MNHIQKTIGTSILAAILSASPITNKHPSETDPFLGALAKKEFTLEQMINIENYQMEPHHEWHLRQEIREHYNKNPQGFFYQINNMKPGEIQTEIILVSKDEVDITLRRIQPYQEHIRETSQKTGIPEELLVSTIIVESTGIPRPSRMGAQGLGQIMIGTYSDLRRQVSTDIRTIKNVMSKEEIESLLEKNWVDYLFMQPQEFTDNLEGFKNYKEYYQISETSLFKHRLPLALTVMKEYESQIPSTGSLQFSLRDPSTNISVMALIHLNNALSIYQSNVELQKAVKNNYSLVNTWTPPEAILTAYNGGLNRTNRLLASAINNNKEYNLSTGSNYFNERIPRETREYIPKIMSSQNMLFMRQ